MADAAGAALGEGVAVSVGVDVGADVSVGGREVKVTDCGVSLGVGGGVVPGVDVTLVQAAPSHNKTKAIHRKPV